MDSSAPANSSIVKSIGAGSPIYSASIIRSRFQHFSDSSSCSLFQAPAFIGGSIPVQPILRQQTHSAPRPLAPPSPVVVAVLGPRPHQRLDVAGFAANGRDYAAPSTTVDSPPTRHVASSPELPQDAPFSPSVPSSTFDIRLLQLQHLAAADRLSVEQCSRKKVGS